MSRVMSSSVVLVAAALTCGYAVVAAVVAPGTPLGALVLILVVGFGTGMMLTGSRRWWGLGLLLVGATTLQVSASYRTAAGDQGMASTFLTPVVIVLGPVMAGGLVGDARRTAARLRTVMAQLAVERDAHAAAAATEERNRIACELHDVISHSVSQMVVQAGAAEQLLDAHAPAREILARIRVTGREALAELREQLGVLRDRPDALPLPVHSLADVRVLAGTHVTLDYDDAAVGHVPPGPALAAYRVVREALTNARRHADGAWVAVRITRVDDQLQVDVVNGPGHPLRGASLSGSGHGLIGMRERVDLYAGELEAGRTVGGGWRVRAVLSLTGERVPA